MPGFAVFTQGEHAIVAKQQSEDAMTRTGLAAGGLAAFALVLWASGLFVGHWEPWVVVAAAIGALAWMPFVTLAQEVHFDREARLITVTATTPRGAQRRQVGFDKVVELRAVYDSSQNGDSGYHLEVQLESWGRVRLNTSKVSETLAFSFVEQLHQFLGGRPTGHQGGRLEAFAFPR